MQTSLINHRVYWTSYLRNASVGEPMSGLVRALAYDHSVEDGFCFAALIETDDGDLVAFNADRLSTQPPAPTSTSTVTEEA